MSDSSELMQPRVKRQKYTSNACNECKRRKARCNGGEPRCARCASFDIQCMYTPSTEGTSARASERAELQRLHEKIDLLQDQLTTLVTHVQTSRIPATTSPSYRRPRADRASIGASIVVSPTSSAGLDQRKQPAYLGPTSSTFGLDVAQAELQRVQPNVIGSSGGEAPRSPSSSTEDEGEENTQPTSYDTQVFERGEALRLIELYEETVGTVYPCVDTGGVKDLAENIFDRSNNAAEACDNIYGLSDSSSIFDRDLEILRTILAVSYAIDDNGRSGPAKILIEKVEDTMFKRFRIIEVDTKELLLFTLLSFYYFYRGDEVMAYRSTGLALRGAIEMGLHRRSTWARTSGIFPGELQRSWAIKLFWCIYVLDRRWSLGTGMPFGLQDEDMDTELPELDETTPYLKCLVSWGRLASKVWKSVANSDRGERRADDETTAYLDFLVQEWSKSVPVSLQIQNAAEKTTTPRARTQRMLQTLLHLRANQMRIILHKPDLLHTEKTVRTSETAHLVVSVARDTIHSIDTLNQSTDIYRRQRAEFDYFLVSAVAVLFLVVSIAPKQFADQARQAFHTVLHLVKGFSSSSLSTRRLWKTIRQLKRLGFNFEPAPATPANTDHGIRLVDSLLHANGRTDVDASSSLTIEHSLNGPDFGLDFWPSDGFQVYQELSGMFESQENPPIKAKINGGKGVDQWSALTDSGGDNALPGLDDDKDNAEFLRLLTDLF